jgi:acetyltransferase
MFYPKSVAVIGVSERPSNMGRNIVSNLLEFGFQGILYLVGPNGGVFATRRIYHSVLDIPDEVELAVILTPAHTVPAVLDECGRKGIRHAVIETAGFREYSDEKRGLESEVLRVARQYGIRFIGPNCIGLINMENGLCLPFPPLSAFIRRGSVSLLAQSGGVGLSVMSLMANEGLRLNKFISAGNMLDTSAEELLEYLIDDPGSEYILLYLEGIQNGRRLMEIARRATKPVLAFKSNTGQLGRHIAASHTSALSSDDKVVDAAFRQSGIVRVYDATSLINGLKALHLPRLRGPRLAVVSRSGGHAVIAADACEASGFELAPFPDEFISEVERHFRASVIRLTNPLDLGDLFDLDVYAQIIEAAIQQPWVDGVVFLHTSSTKTERDKTRELVSRLENIIRQYDKPIAFYLSGAADEVNYLKKNYKIPIFSQVVETIRALELSYRCYNQQQQVHIQDEAPPRSVERQPAAALIAEAQAAGRNLLLPEALAVLNHYGIPVIPYRVARNRQEALDAAGSLGYPVALKVISAAVSHKSDLGGVKLHLCDQAAVAAAFDEIAASLEAMGLSTGLEGVLVQPMAASGEEIILGGRQDAQFGPVVLAGLGGIFVEILGEASMRVAPVGPREAMGMLRSLRAAPILMGARGRQPADLPALADAIMRLSQLLCDFPAIQELDINPLRAYPAGQGCQALDARILLTKSPAPVPTSHP